MKKIFKLLLYFIIFLIVFIVALLVKGYYTKYIEIDNQYKLINDKTGYALIERNSSYVVVSTPIVWYCVSKKYIMGCIGEDIFDKKESYIPTCLQDKYFIVDKHKAKNIGLFNEWQFNNFIQSHNVTCKKEYIYEK